MRGTWKLWQQLFLRNNRQRNILNYDLSLNLCDDTDHSIKSMVATSFQLLRMQAGLSEDMFPFFELLSMPNRQTKDRPVGE